MKKLIYYFAVMMLTLSFGISDSFAQAANKREFNVENSGKTYQLQKDSLTVAINNIGQYDVVAVEPSYVSTGSKNKPLTVKAWELSYNEGNAADSTIKLSKLENIAPIESTMNFDKGVLMVNGLANSSKRSVIHLTLPRGVNTKIYINGVMVQSGSLSGDGLMLQDGNNITNKGYSSESALMQAVIPNTHKPAPTSYKRIDWQTLSTMALKTVETPIGFSDNQENWAMLQVDVSETGKVKTVLYAGGNEALASVAKQYLAQYEFKPFLIDDKPIKVKSLVPVGVIDGQIKLLAKVNNGKLVQPYVS